MSNVRVDDISDIENIVNRHVSKVVPVTKSEHEIRALIHTIVVKSFVKNYEEALGVVVPKEDDVGVHIVRIVEQCMQLVMFWPGLA